MAENLFEPTEQKFTTWKHSLLDNLLVYIKFIVKE